MTARLLFIVLLTVSAAAQPLHRRALLIGINDYSASTLHALRPLPAVPGRDLPSLTGALNDVRALSAMLTGAYGFDARDILTLTDQQATRAAILAAVRGHLVKAAARGDVLFFYYAGHGAQVLNTASDEPDKLDESIVPADSRIGAPDIRDKDLRPLFNQIVARGGRLTVMIDACHSGSGGRGLPSGAQPRGVKPDLRDVADATNYGPRPEDNGALVISASHDFDDAYEVRDSEGHMHGAFTWAWLRALRDASSDEMAEHTFARAEGRLRSERPYQDPVLAGNAETRNAPFLGTRVDRHGAETVLAVEKVRSDGTILLRGGWVNGLAPGCELHPIDGRNARVVVEALRGLDRSIARTEPPMRTVPDVIHSGTLLSVAGWTSMPNEPLRIWVPRIDVTSDSLAALARTFRSAASGGGVRWITDPTDRSPRHVLRWWGAGWELLAAGRTERLPSDGAALAAIRSLPSGETLFVQLPAPNAIAREMVTEGVDSVRCPEDADYVLAGCLTSRGVSYAWVRPGVVRADRRKSGLPLRTEWTSIAEAAPRMRDSLLRLRKIAAWHQLSSPPAALWPYELGLVRRRDNELIRDGRLTGGDTYDLILRAGSLPLPKRILQRHIYVFMIDSFGRSVLLYPRFGSVENHFPIGADEHPFEIPLGAASAIEVTPPFGVDTYFLLSTAEALPNPWILEWDGVRTRAAHPTSALERLLLITAGQSRGAPPATGANWSIERFVFESEGKEAGR
jgi:caspase domain-containing protein